MRNPKLTAVFMSALMVLSASVLVMDATDAIGEDLSGQYGTASEISIAPGFQWRYTPEFPSDLSEFVTVTLQVNDSGIGAVDGKTVIATIPSDAPVGTVYNMVIKAAMTEPVEQEAYQYVRFTVVNGLDVSGTINDIVLGSSIDFTPIGTSDMGTVTWTVKSGTTLPEGLSLVDGKVVGTPTQIGTQTVSLTGNSRGESADLEVTFTVYSVIVGDSDEIIFSHGNTVSSRGIVNGTDLGVTWTVTSGELPAGFDLDPVTGIVTGSSTEVSETTVTITGASASGPTQTVSKDITIRSESELVLKATEDILTYKGNPEKVVSKMSVPAVSDMTWSVDHPDATVDYGIVSVTDPSTVGMDQTITITVTTEYGQTDTATIRLSVEDTLAVSGETVLNAIAGTAKQSAALTVTGGSDNRLEATTSAPGLTVGIVDGELQVLSASPMQDKVVTITATSAAGQTVTTDVIVDVYNVLAFSNSPTGGAIIYAM